MLSMSFFFIILLSSLYESASCCSEVERDSLLSFYQSISSPRPSTLNWSESTDCCLWQGITCTPTRARVTHLWLPERRLSGTINTSFLANLPVLAHLNLSLNHLSGPLRSTPPLPRSIQTVDLSSNRFNGSLDPSFLLLASNLTSFNVSNNSFTGSIPTSSICKASTLIRYLDFSMNHFSGPLSPGLGQCPNLEVLRAGANSLSGWLPYDLYNATKLREISMYDNQFSGPINGTTIVTLSNLTILDLHLNQLSGDIPPNIGLLSNLESLLLHTNTLHGSLPPSLMNCTKLKTLLLRDNRFEGDVSPLNFSKLLNLQAIDLGSNAFTGNIPRTLCSCVSLVAVRFSHNQLVGEIPACMASLTSLQHLALANNNLSNVVGAFKILSHCHNLAVLILWATFHDETMPTDNDLLHVTGGFQNLQILTLGDCKLKGHIPTWIAGMKKLKQLDLSQNKIRGTIPSWLGDMPSLCILNLTQNLLWGHLPWQLTRMPALASAPASDNEALDLSYLQLPLLIDGRQYSRLYNLRRGLAVGSNSLGGGIPPEIGALKLLQVLDLSDNQFSGGIPGQLAALTNLERLNLSKNSLSGEIPQSLKGLHFLSWLSVANNDLQGEIPRGGQFDTFPPNSFEGNPKLCGFVISRMCSGSNEAESVPAPAAGEGKDFHISWYSLPFGLGYSVGLFAVTIATFFKNGYG